MGVNASSYPHSCSPRFGSNSQTQQTFIGKLPEWMAFILLCSHLYLQRVVYSNLNTFLRLST